MYCVVNGASKFDKKGSPPGVRKKMESEGSRLPLGDMISKVSRDMLCPSSSIIEERNDSAIGMLLPFSVYVIS